MSHSAGESCRRRELLCNPVPGIKACKAVERRNPGISVILGEYTHHSVAGEPVLNRISLKTPLMKHHYPSKRCKPDPPRRILFNMHYRIVIQVIGVVIDPDRIPPETIDSLFMGSNPEFSGLFIGIKAPYHLRVTVRRFRPADPPIFNDRYAAAQIGRSPVW